MNTMTDEKQNKQKDKVERKYDRVSQVARRRGFYWPSSEIYGGIAGFFDYGPVGALLKRKIEQEWRNVFIVQDGLFEIETPTLMPRDVFVGSGHVDSFTDPLVACVKCEESYRADHVVHEVLKVDTEGMGLEELDALIKKNKIPCHKCKSALGDVWSFNLMFKTETGAGKKTRTVHLRPETAQGMFVAVNRLYEVARKRLPFGACQIGKSYRNEISPRQGMIRLREFTQAEAEIFYNPKQKTHPRFDEIKNDVLPLYPATYQESNRSEILETTVEQAVKEGLIASELQAYYLARSVQFFERIGLGKDVMRVRQQVPDERAHYSVDTWDIEIRSEDFGWVEVCAVADRTDFDVKGHAALSKQDLTVHHEGEKFIPHVMEASFGIDRPVYCALETAFKEDEKRTWFKLAKKVAPISAGVFPLLKKDGLPEKAQEVMNLLKRNNIMAQYDESGSIGKRYARSDEIGIPQCITIDHQTLEDDTVTIRDRDTTEQKRVKVDKILWEIWEG